MGYTMSKLVAEPFTNSIGQTLNPGDEVVAVTTGYCHHVSVFTGKFAGVRRDKESNKIVGTSVSDIPVVHNERVYCEDGEIEEQRHLGWDPNTRGWRSENTGRRYNLVPVTKYRKSSLQLNRVFKIDTPLNKVTV
jgi:hypothetical protein